MNKWMFAMAGAAFLASSGALAQMVDSMADCNKHTEMVQTAYNNHDADALANMYDAKAGMHSSETWTATGHDAILAGFEDEMKSGVSLTSLICDHSNKTGATNVADGAWAATVKGPGGKDFSVQGHWIRVSEIRDGKDVGLVYLQNMQIPQPHATK